MPEPRSRRAGMRLAALGALLFVLVGLAVALQAQQVTGQVHLDSLRAKLAATSIRQAELRSSVAEAESPKRIIESAHALGMIDPAAIAPVPAPPPTTTASPARRG